MLNGGVTPYRITRTDVQLIKKYCQKPLSVGRPFVKVDTAAVRGSREEYGTDRTSTGDLSDR